MSAFIAIEILVGKKIQLYLLVSRGASNHKTKLKADFPSDNAASETPINPKATTSTQGSIHLAIARFHLLDAPLSSTSQSVDLE